MYVDVRRAYGSQSDGGKKYIYISALATGMVVAKRSCIFPIADPNCSQRSLMPTFFRFAGVDVVKDWLDSSVKGWIHQAMENWNPSRTPLSRYIAFCEKNQSISI